MSETKKCLIIEGQLYINGGFFLPFISMRIEDSLFNHLLSLKHNLFQGSMFPPMGGVQATNINPASNPFYNMAATGGAAVLPQTAPVNFASSGNRVSIVLDKQTGSCRLFRMSLVCLSNATLQHLFKS